MSFVVSGFNRTIAGFALGPLDGAHYVRLPQSSFKLQVTEDLIPSLSSHEEGYMRFPLDNVDGDDMEQTTPQTEDSRERGFVRSRDLSDLGRSDELENQDAGDIADEGPGRRG